MPASAPTITRRASFNTQQTRALYLGLASQMPGDTAEVELKTGHRVPGTAKPVTPQGRVSHTLAGTSSAAECLYCVHTSSYLRSHFV